MSNNNNEDRDLSLPGISPDRRPNAGAINGMQDLVSTPAPDWGKSPPVASVAKAKAKADWEAAKERAVQADPSTLGPADRFARHQAPGDQHTAAKAAARDQAANTTAAAGQAPEAAGTAPATKVRKPRATKARDQALDAPDGTQKAKAVAKPPRSRSKAASKATSTQQQTQSAVGSAPAMDDRAMPPITPEAITFLSNPDATAMDLFMLPPESQAFVQYHITNMQRADAERELNMSYLASITPKYSPAFEKVADALLAKLDKDRRAGIKLPMPAPAKPAAAQLSGVSYRPKIMPAIAYRPTSVQLGTMLIQQDKRTAGIEADSPSRSSSQAGEKNSENSIERGIAPERENQPVKDSRSTPSVDSADTRVMPPSSALALGSRMLRAMGVWLQGKAEGKPVPAPGVKPAHLDKQAALAMAMADNKANVVPDAVAQRFLKVERNYYFQDKTLAFSDRGNKLATRGAHPEVVRSLIEIAQARGWDSITVKGTDEFRRSAWMAATQAGLKVAGYKPSALDLAELASKPATNSVEKSIVKERESAAIQRSKAGATAQEKAAHPVPSAELEAKARAFEMEKPGFVVKKFPELAQAYGVVDAAKKFAEVHLAQDVRDEFVSLARRHVMQKILSGEQVKGPQIYAAPAKAKNTVEHVHAPAQPAANSGNSARSKEIPRER